MPCHAMPCREARTSERRPVSTMCEKGLRAWPRGLRSGWWSGAAQQPVRRQGQRMREGAWPARFHGQMAEEGERERTSPTHEGGGEKRWVDGWMDGSGDGRRPTSVCECVERKTYAWIIATSFKRWFR
ncbi:hypothetical protein BC567DRAFT_234286 [Phyllosticta citribraziliensis]